MDMYPAKHKTLRSSHPSVSLIFVRVDIYMPTNVRRTPAILLKIIHHMLNIKMCFSLFHRAFFNSIMDKTPTHALFTQHHISLAC